MVSIILKGKIHQDINKLLKYYKSISDNVIVSSWTDQRIYDIIDRDNFNYIDNIILNDYPIAKTDFAIKNYSLYCQTHNILQGLKKVDSGSLVLVLRLDEYYNNLHLFYDKFHENPNKLITNNIYFRHADYANGTGVIHPSDHILCQTKERLQSCYEILNNLFLTNDVNRLYYSQFEAILGQCYIESFNDERIKDIKQHKELRKDYLSFINVEKLRDYKVVNNRTGKIFYNNFNPHEIHQAQLSVTNENEI